MKNEHITCDIGFEILNIKIFTILGEPDGPSAVALCVASSSSLLVKFSEPDSHNGAVVTRYKGKEN